MPGGFCFSHQKHKKKQATKKHKRRKKDLLRKKTLLCAFCAFLWLLLLCFLWLVLGAGEGERRRVLHFQEALGLFAVEPRRDFSFHRMSIHLQRRRSME